MQSSSSSPFSPSSPRSLSLHADGSAGLLLAIAPLSPSDTNPPLGPWLLKHVLAQEGISVQVVDLGIRYLDELRAAKGGACRNASRCDVATALVGDQDKNRRLTHAARDRFVGESPLALERSEHVPCSADPVLALSYSFDAVDRAVERLLVEASWVNFVHRWIFNPLHDTRPIAFGVSIMGPAQVVPSLALAAMAHARWPGIPVIAGGSHVTLLAPEIGRDARYGGHIDLFLPGHSEHELVSVMRVLSSGGTLATCVGLRAGSEMVCAPRFVPLTHSKNARRVGVAKFAYESALDREALEGYDLERVTIPMQLTRGCAYGKCTYCTYPAVEPEVSSIDLPRALTSIERMIQRTCIRRFSFKDSFFTPRALRELADGLLDAQVEMEWSATTMLNNSLDDALLARLASAGCRTLEFGLETIDGCGQSMFAKPLDRHMAERVIATCVRHGVAVVVNQIFGFPGQTQASALEQLAWFDALRSASSAPELIHASCNLLEINRGAPMAKDPAQFEIELQGIAPWAFSYAWNAPAWRPAFGALLRGRESCGVAEELLVESCA